MSHGIGCAVLQTSARLLSDDKTMPLLPPPSSSADSRALVAQVLEACASAWPDLHRELTERLSALTGRSQELAEAVRESLQRSRILGDPQISELHVRESAGAHGRCLRIVGNVTRGTELMNETPFCVTQGLCCRCGETALSPLLPEHVAMALLLHSAGHKATAEPLCRLQSHLPATQSLSPSCSFWSESSRLLLAVTAVLTLLSTQQLSTHCSSSLAAAIDLFEILARLPTNVHAVSSLVEGPGSGVVSLCQERSFFGLFLRASAANHCCEPNCLLVHDLPFVKLVSTAPILAGDELTISYGPTAPMDVRQRRRALREQYLFECRCPACERETARILDERNSNRLDDPGLASEVRGFALEFRRVSGCELGEVGAPPHCTELEGFILRLRQRLGRGAGSESTYGDEKCVQEMGKLLSSALDIKARCATCHDVLIECIFTQIVRGRLYADRGDFRGAAMEVREAVNTLLDSGGNYCIIVHLGLIMTPSQAFIASMMLRSRGRESSLRSCLSCRGSSSRLHC